MAFRALRHFLFSILMVSLFANVLPTAKDGCPKIHVTKNRILRTREAINDGAKYLKRTHTEKATDCYKLCCQHSRCNLAMLSYKNSTTGDGRVVRQCYLFDCGSPSKCKFSPYPHYATIEFEDRKEVPSGFGSSDVDEEYTEKAKPVSKSGVEEECPPGVPVAMCRSNPCNSATCPLHSWATCKPSFCGGCKAKFYDDDGATVKCHADRNEETDLETMEKPKEDHNDWMNDILKEQKKSPLKPPHKSRQHVSSTSHRNHEQSFEDKLEEATNTGSATATQNMHDSWREETHKEKLPNPTTAESFHHWREFIDNNPKYGKVKKVTEKPKPEHNKVPEVYHRPTYPVQPKTHTKPTHKVEIQPTKPHLVPKVKPTQGRNAAPHNVPKRPKPDDEAGRRNGSDVVVIETSHLRIVENKAVLPLAIFLVIAILMLFVVALRLRIVKSRLRRKAFATDDADYLINGMYL